MASTGQRLPRGEVRMRSATATAVVRRRLSIVPDPTRQPLALAKRRPAFSYVGPSQVFAWLGFGVLRLASRRARAAQGLPQPERSVPAGVVVPDMFPSAVVGASKQPRRFHSAIRAQEIKSLAHEILYDEIDAHSRSRAHTAVEALAQKGARAVDPDPALRGFDDSLLGCNHGGPARNHRILEAQDRDRQ